MDQRVMVSEEVFKSCITQQAESQKIEPQVNHEITWLLSVQDSKWTSVQRHSTTYHGKGEEAAQGAFISESEHLDSEDAN